MSGESQPFGDNRVPATRGLPAWAPALIAGSLALLLRLLYVFDVRDGISFLVPVLDEAVNDEWARGRFLFLHQDSAFFRAPLYVWFLQFVYSIDAGALLPRVLQALMGGLVVSIVADAGRRLAGPIAGLASGVVLALTWTSIYFTGELRDVTLFLTLVLAGLWALVVAAEKDRPWVVWIAAALLGLASIARPGALVAVALLPLLTHVVWSRRPGSVLASGRHGLLAVAAVLVLLPGLAVTVRNAVVGDEWVFIASESGHTFHLAHREGADGHRDALPGPSGTWAGGYQAAVQRAEEQAGRELRTGEVGAHYFREGLRWIAASPGDALALYGAKLRFLFGSGERPGDENPNFWRARSNVLRWPFYLDFAPVLALGLVGIALCRRRALAAPVWIFLAAYAFVVLAFAVNAESRLPLTTALAVFAGIPVAHLVAAAHARRWREGSLVLAVVLAVWGASAADRIGFDDDRVDLDARSRNDLGTMYVRAGDFRAAVSEYQTAIDIGRSHPERAFDEIEVVVRKNMVRTLFRLSEFDAAVQHLERLESRFPDDSEVWVLRGRHLLWQHDSEDARPLFRRAIDEGHGSAEAHIGLGWCQIEFRAYTAAARSFRRALELEPGSAEAIAGLAWVEGRGRKNSTRANELARDALDIDWEVPRAHEILGLNLRASGRLPEAVYHFREALRLDPKNMDVIRALNRMGVEHEHAPGARRPRS